jgi:hypothetical protein
VTSGVKCEKALLKSAAVLLAAWPWPLRRKYWIQGPVRKAQLLRASVIRPVCVRVPVDESARLPLCAPQQTSDKLQKLLRLTDALYILYLSVL